MFLAANPINTLKLDLEQEFAGIFRGLQDSINFNLVAEWAVTTDILQSAILKHKPEIVHFSGHGNGGIILQDSEGNAHEVPEVALTNLFAILLKKIPIKIVVLNACFSNKQAKAINEHVPYVIGMGDAISDNSAITFATSFYRNIVTEDDIEFAFDLAKNSIALEALSGENTPILFKNKQANKLHS